MIDLTDLADDRSADGIAALCARAQAHRTAAVCVWPEFVERCSVLLDGTDVRVATVVNFPSGEEPIDEVCRSARAALAAGADEIDVVIPYRAMAAGGHDEVRRLLREVRAAVRTPALMKVILETGELASPDLIVAAAEMAIDAEADFLKTSTGKSPVSATHEAVHLMLAVIRESGQRVGIKPSGGIRTVADASTYLALADEMMGPQWVSAETFRFGASGLLDDVVAVLDGTARDSPEDGY